MQQTTKIRLFGSRAATLALSVSVIAVLSGCSGMDLSKREAKYPTGGDRAATNDDIYAEEPSIFGEGGLRLLGGKGKEKESAQTGLGVNSYLWRATLDTVSFMPLASADPFGGVILTDWYTPPESPRERLKVNAFILDKHLRADGIKVKVFRQVRQGGDWKDATVADDTARKMEEAILTRARQIRVASEGDL